MLNFEAWSSEIGMKDEKKEKFANFITPVAHFN